jgi:hypothetical protein
MLVPSRVQLKAHRKFRRPKIRAQVRFGADDGWLDDGLAVGLDAAQCSWWTHYGPDECKRPVPPRV